MDEVKPACDKKRLVEKDRLVETDPLLVNKQLLVRDKAERTRTYVCAHET